MKEPEDGSLIEDIKRMRRVNTQLHKNDQMSNKSIPEAASKQLVRKPEQSQIPKVSKKKSKSKQFQSSPILTRAKRHKIKGQNCS